jgi:hormone-sensitive lipase
MCCSRDLKGEVTHVSDRVILHIHGGGFISMSSHCHENYTRRWAIETKTPIISVDYRTAPKDPFPAGIDDVWQVYVWILEHAQRQLGIVPNQIIIAGDSAGGNIAAGIM